MIIQLLKSDNATSFTTSVTLSNMKYNLKFFWNVYGKFWYMNIHDTNEELVSAGIVLVGGRDLLSGFRNSKTPPLELYLEGISGVTDVPTLNTISSYYLNYIG